MSSSRLETVFNVSSALADNTTSGLAGLLDYNASRPDSKRFDAIRKSIETEGIDLRLQLAVKRLVSRYDAQEGSFLGYGDDPQSIETLEEILGRAIDAGRGEELHTVLGILLPMRKGMACPALDHGLQPGMVPAMLHRVPRLGISFLRLLVEDGLFFREDRRPRDFSEELFERLLDPRQIFDMMEHSPEVAGEVIELSMRIGGHRWTRRLAEMWGRCLDAPEFRDLVMRRPEFFLGMLAVLEWSGTPSGHERLFEDVIDRVEAGDLVDMVHRRPGAGVRLIGILRKREGRRVGGLTHEVLEHLLLSRDYLRELIARRQDVAAELIELFKKALPRSQTAPVLVDLLHEFHPRQLGQLLRLDPPTGGRVLSALISPDVPSEEWLEQFLDPRSVVDLLWRREDATAELLRLIVEFEPSKWSRVCLDRLIRSEPSGELKRLLRKIPVGAAQRLKSLAESKNSRALAVALREVLASSE